MRPIDLVIRQLLHRFQIQCTKKVRNYPFLMGQGIWIDSEDLGPDDSVAEVLKHGTLSVGFIGLAETLKALTGAHHGESEESQKLGLEIISHMRQRMDDESEKTGLNFSLLATPAEGLSGRFVRIDKKIYGEMRFSAESGKILFWMASLSLAENLSVSRKPSFRWFVRCAGWEKLFLPTAATHWSSCWS